MKITVISDLHGKTVWKDILKKEKDSDLILFLGDYFDCYENIPAEEQIQNFKDIMDLKTFNPKQDVIALIGNHDHHYVRPNERYSGYQEDASTEIGDVINDAIEDEDLQVAFEHGKFLFSHAGFTQSWINDSFTKGFASVEEINELYHTDSPRFDFYRKGKSSNGNDKEQGPLWVRPESLEHDFYGTQTQVVGHTKEKSITMVDDPNTNMAVIYTDVLDKVNQYLIITDDVVTIGKI